MNLRSAINSFGLLCAIQQQPAIGVLRTSSCEPVQALRVTRAHGMLPDLAYRNGSLPPLMSGKKTIIRSAPVNIHFFNPSSFNRIEPQDGLCVYTSWSESCGEENICSWSQR